MALRTFEDVVRLTVDRLYPGNPGILPGLLDAISPTARRPISFIDLTNGNGNQNFMVGLHAVGNNNPVG